MNYSDILSEKATTLAQLVTDDGKQIKVVGYSLIQELINEALQRQVREDLIPGSSFGEGSLYNALSDSAVAQLAEVLQAVCNVTFNDAVPMIKSIMEKMRQVMNPDIPVAYSTSEVKPVIYEEIWDTPLVMDLAARGRNVTPSSVSLTGMIKSVLDEAYSNLGELAMSGLPSVDEKLTAIIGGYEGTALTMLFTEVFSNGWLPSENPRELILGNQHCDKNDWIIITMWARNLRDIAPKDSSVGLDRYKMNLLALEEKAAQVIAGVDELRRSHSENDTLVLDIRGQTIYVNSDLYTDFLSTNVGGTPEAVLGVALQEAGGRRQITSAAIIADKAQLEKAWNRHVAITTVKHGEQMASTARRQLHLIIEQAAAERVTTNKLTSDDLESILNKIADEVRELPSDFTVDTHRWVFDIVGRVFYPESNVNMLLTNLREVGDIKDSGFSAEEVRVVAVINFMGDWLADSMTLTDHGGGKGAGNYSAYVGSQAMGLEGLQGVPGSIKEWAQLIGLMILGAGVGYAIGTLLNKLFYGKDKAEKVGTALATLEQRGVKEVSRADLIEVIRAEEKGDMPSIVMHVFNDDEVARKLTEAMHILEGANITALVMEVKDLLSTDPSRNESSAKAFISKSEDLVKKLGGVTDKALKGLAKISGVQQQSRGFFTSPNAPVEVADAILEDIDKASEAADAIFEPLVGVDRLRKDGVIEVAAVASNVQAIGHAIETQSKGMRDLTKSTQSTIDGDDLKAFKQSSDEASLAVDRLSMALKVFSKSTSLICDYCTVPLGASAFFAMVAAKVKTK